MAQTAHNSSSHVANYDVLVNQVKKVPHNWYKPQVASMVDVKMDHWFDAFLADQSTQTTLLQAFTRIGLLDYDDEAIEGTEDKKKKRTCRLPPIPPSFLKSKASIEERLNKHGLVPNVVPTPPLSPTSHEDTTSNSSTLPPEVSSLEDVPKIEETAVEALQEPIIEPTRSNDVIAAESVSDKSIGWQECVELPTQISPHSTAHPLSKKSSPQSFATCVEDVDDDEVNASFEDPVTDTKIKSVDVVRSTEESYENVILPTCFSPAMDLLATFEESGVVPNSFNIEHFIELLAPALKEYRICSYLASSLTRLLIIDHLRTYAEANLPNLTLTLKVVVDESAKSNDAMEDGVELIPEDFQMTDSMDIEVIDSMLQVVWTLVNHHRGETYAITGVPSLFPSIWRVKRILDGIISDDVNVMLFNLLTYTEAVLFGQGQVDTLLDEWKVVDDAIHGTLWQVDAVSGLPHHRAVSLFNTRDSPVDTTFGTSIERSTGLLKSVSTDTFDIHLKALIHGHPSMAFLVENHEFVHHFMTTVKCRLEYRLNDSLESRIITLPALRSTSIAMVWSCLEDVHDINSFRQFFGYESFYVVFYKFYELDHDHDMVLKEVDFHRYDGHGMLQSAIVRLFDPTFTFLETPGRMTYREYLNFLWMDEDKMTMKSIVFWFKFFDLDGDGVVTSHEIEHFFTEQFLRYESIMQEALTYSDMLCQLNDVMMPQEQGKFTVDDFLRHPKLLTELIENLISMTKTVRHENKDPYALLNDAERHPYDNDWDRYIRYEYETLAGYDSYDGY